MRARFADVPALSAEAALEVLPQPVAIVDCSGTVVRSNRAWAELAGRAAGTAAANLLAAAEQAAPEAGWRQVLAGRQAAAAAEVCQSADGRREWFRVTLTALPGGGGVASALEISELRQARQEAEENAARFHDIAEVTSDWFWEMGPDLRFTYFSDRTPEKTGTTLADALGKSRSEVADISSDPEGWRRHLDDLEARRPFRDFTYVHRRRDGATRHFRISGMPRFGKDGGFLGYRGTGTDITVQVEAERRAAAAQSQLAAAIESLGEAFAIFDADDRLILCNQHYRELFAPIVGALTPGTTFESILRLAVAEDLHPEARGREAAFIAERLHHHRNPTGPLEIARQDDRWFLAREQRLPDGSTVIVAAEVTELKRAQQRLLDAIEALADGFALFDAEGRLLLCNRRYLTVLPGALTIDDVRGRTLEEILRLKLAAGIVADPLAQSDPEAWVRMRRARFGNPSEEPLVQQFADGRWFEIRERRTREGGIVAVWADITQRKQREIALAELGQQYEHKAAQLSAALANMDQGLCFFGPDRRLVVYNQRYLDLYGLPASRVQIGATLEDIMRVSVAVGNYPPEQAEAIVAERQAVVTAGRRRTFQQRLSSGRIIEVQHVPLESGGFVATYADVTGREATLSELFAAKEAAEAASRAKTTFLATMSHELRTPLNAVIGFSEVLDQQFFGPLNERQLAYVADIHRSGRHLLALINDILDLSKIEAGKLQIHEEAVDTGHLLQEAVQLLRGRADAGQVVLELALAPDLPPLRADALRLKQVALNLIANAVKFTPAGGTVSVDASGDGRRGTVIRIRDTGIGMSEEEIRIAIEPFGQVTNPLSRSHEGTGLGLPLAKRLVELQGGRLDIDSAPQRGTTITIRLPAATA